MHIYILTTENTYGFYFIPKYVTSFNTKHLHQEAFKVAFIPFHFKERETEAKTH